jgi:AAA family ATP:ADP antiporter
VYGFFTVNLVAFYIWFNLQQDHTWIARTYYVWVSVFNFFIVAVFWSLMADVFTREQAGRMFGFIAAGASTGGLLGPLVAGRLAVPLGTINRWLISAALLATALFFMRRVIHWHPHCIFSDVDFWVRASSLLTQLFLFSRLCKWIGLRALLVSVPLIMTAGYAIFALLPSFAVLVVVFAVRRVGEYAISRPCRDSLYTVCTREEKYKAKSLIDTLIYRGGDATSASAFHVLTSGLGVGPAGVGWAGAGISVIWLAIALALGKSQIKLPLPVMQWPRQPLDLDDFGARSSLFFCCMRPCGELGPGVPFRVTVALR